MKKILIASALLLSFSLASVAQSNWSRAEASSALDIRLAADAASKSVADSNFHVASGDTLGFTLNKLYYGNIHLVKINKSLAGEFKTWYSAGANAASQSARKIYKVDATNDAPADLNGCLFSGWKATNYYVEFNGIKFTLE